MPDTAALYVLTTPAGVLQINNMAAPDGLFIDDEGSIDGLDDPEVRDTVKWSPQTDGQYVGPNFLAGYRPTFNGICIVNSFDIYTQCDEYRAAMVAIELDTRTKLRSILGGGGSLSWDGRTLSNVSYDSAVLFPGPMLKHRFIFGLASPDSDIT